MSFLAPDPLRRHAPVPLALGLLLSLIAAPLSALAHGPTRHKVVETITIQAPPAKVWSVMGAFDALKQWHPAVADSAASQGNAVGSVRVVKLKDGGTIEETLETYDAGQMKYSYRAKDGGALPVTNYTATLRLSEQQGQTQVEWRGAFYRGHPNNDPPPDRNDEAAVQAVTGVYRSGLAQLKQVAEQSR